MRISCRLDWLLAHSMGRKYRDRRFTRYVKKQKTLQKMCNMLTADGGKDTIIGFGDFNNRHVIRLSQAVSQAVFWHRRACLLAISCSR